jgi:uncharacterized protein (TIGR02466 family)
MQIHSLFETLIVSHDCECDNETIYQEVKQHQNKVESVKLSNNGGYQGHYFESNSFFDLVAQVLPRRSDKPIVSFDLQSWVNINFNFSWNDIHTHDDDGVLISGVYYVATPDNCGNIRLYDPRFLKGINNYDKYYCEDRGNYITIPPKEKMILMFPPWLPHMVEPNLSNHERISIAFNVINVKF